MSAQKIKLTDHRVDTWIPPKDGKEHYLWDSEVKGLCVRAVGNSRAFYLYRRVNGKPKRERIGAVGEVLLRRAREIASAWNAELHAGRALTPLANVAAPEGRPAVRSLGSVFADYIEAVKGTKRTWEADVLFYNRWLKAWADMPFDDIDRAFVKARYLEVRDGKMPRRWRNGATPKGWKQRPTPVQAARFVTLLGSIIKWEWNRRLDDGYHGDVPEMPTRGFLSRMGHKENKTYAESLLPESEFVAIIRAIDSHEAAGGNRVRCDALRLMAWTGLRKRNILRLQWEWVNLDAERPYIEVPTGEFKGRRQHIVPLIPQAVMLLRRWRSDRRRDAKYVLPGRAEDGHVGDLRPSWDKVRELAGLSNRKPRVRMHDVRGHTATKLHRLGVPIGTIMAIMGWKNLATAQRYIRASRDEQFDAMDRYAKAWGVSEPMPAAEGEAA